MAVSLKQLRDHLAEIIDPEDLLQRELADRYVMLTGSLRRLDRQIRKDGERVEVVNSHQRYLKAHPLIKDRARLNRELLAIEKQLHAKSEAAARRRDKKKERAEKQRLHREHQERVEEVRKEERAKAAKQVEELLAKLAEARKPKPKPKPEPEPAETDRRAPLI